MMRMLSLAGVPALCVFLLLGGCSDGPGSVTGGLGDRGDSAVDPRLAMNELGTAFLVWEQSRPAGTDIASNSHVPPAGFGGVEFVTTGGAAKDGDVAMNHYSGDAVFVWAEQDRNGDWGVRGRRYDGTAHQWGPSVLIAQYDDPGNRVDWPRVATDSAGNATVVWTRRSSLASEPAHYEVYASDSLVAAGGDVWTAPTQLDRAAAEGLDAWSPAIAMNEDGDAVVTFIYFTVTPRPPPTGRELAEMHAVFYTVPFDAGPRVWSAPIHIGDETGHVTWGSNRVAIDAQTNAIAVWQEESSPGRVVANRRAAGAGFGGPQSLGGGTGNASAPDIATDYYGDRWILVWAEQDASGGASSIYARHFVQGSWGDPVLLEDSDRSAYTPRVDMGLELGALAVWIQKDEGGVDSVYGSAFFGSWSDPDLAEQDDQPARSPVLALDGLGALGIAAWVRDDGTTTDIWANTFHASTGWDAAGAR